MGAAIIRKRDKIFATQRGYDDRTDCWECPDGNQFIARIWRTTHKNEITTQKANEGLAFTTQKDNTATQKPLNATQKKILKYLSNSLNREILHTLRSSKDFETRFSGRF